MLWRQVSKWACGLVVALAAKGSLLAQLPISAPIEVLDPTPDRGRSPFVASTDAGSLLIGWRRIPSAGSGLFDRAMAADGTLSAPHIVTGEFSGMMESLGTNRRRSFVVTWTQSHGFSQCVALQLTPAGTPAAPEVVLQNPPSTHCVFPDAFIREAGGFVVAAETLPPGDEYTTEIRVWRFSATSQPLGSAVLVNEPRLPWQVYTPSIAGDRLGGFVVAWAEALYAPESTPSHVRARRFDALGAPLGGPFEVATTSHYFWGPQIAMASSGAFVVAWAALRADGLSYEVFARLFAPDGAPLGPVFQVNQHTRSMQYEPTVELDSVGNFAVIWRSEYSTLSDGLDEVMARVYRPDGSPMTDEFLVNVPASMVSESEPTLALDDTGVLSVAYVSEPSGAWGVDIMMRQFLVACPPEAQFLTLYGGRFQLCGRWAQASGATGAAMPLPATETAGAFALPLPAQPQLFVEVRDDCAARGTFSIHATSETTLGIDLAVRDTQSGRVFSLSRPIGQTFTPVHELDALPCATAPPQPRPRRRGL